MTDTLLTALGAVIGAPIGLALALWAPGAIIKRRARREPAHLASPRMAYRAALAHKRRALATLDTLSRQVEADARNGRADTARMLADLARRTV